jgi:uncharacterized membrane protein YuzA (DUF378 family)
MLTLIAVSIFGLLGCQSTQSNITSVGPSIGGFGNTNALGAQAPKYSYNSDVFLDVAIAVFDPGIPLDQNGYIDDEEVAEQGIWPQVRRLEANRFAIYTKQALGETKSFGAINVTPNTNATSDLYIIGKINQSNTEMVEIAIKVIDASNGVWGEQDFEYQVGQGFYRDALRKGTNPYAPVFKEIARYVHQLLLKQSEAKKNTIKQIADVRYAAMYSPEAFAKYLEQDRNNRFKLKGMPSKQDPMYQRVALIQAKDEQFVDDLQNSYEAFHAQTQTPYRDYHRETLPIAVGIRAEKEKRTRAQVGAATLGLVGILLGKNSNSSLGQAAAAVAGVAAVYSLSEAVQANDNLHAQREILDEQGQNLDLTVTPQVLEFNEQTIELNGTAGEQHAQLRQKLLEIHQLEATPMTKL